MRAMNKEQQRRTSKKGQLLTFSSINKAFAGNTSQVLCLFVIIPLSHGSDDSVDQSTDGVCSSNLLAPFQTSQYPNGGVLRDE